MNGQRAPYLSWVFIFIPLVLLSMGQVVAQSTPQVRVPTIVDSIGMTQLTVPDSELGYKELGSPAAVFSPDRTKFIVVTYHGNLDRNSTDASLWLFTSATAFLSPNPDVILTWTSLSNEPAISDVRWLSDNNTIVFLGMEGEQPLQIYSLNVTTRELRQLTYHGTDIVAFDVTDNLSTTAYLARRPVTSIFDQATRNSGLVISDQGLADLLYGRTSDKYWASPLELFVSRGNSGPEQIIFREPETPDPQEGLHLSPDGRYVLMESDTQRYPSPQSWKQYQTPFGENQSVFSVFLLIDINTRSARYLVDAPSICISCLVWSGDGRSAVVSGTYLPLDADSLKERKLRRSTQWAVEVNVETGAITKIARGSYRILRFDSSTNTVVLKPLTFFDVGARADVAITYRKNIRQWAEVNLEAAKANPHSDLEVYEEQDMNTPPRLFASNPQNGKRALLLDLNPQFQEIRFGHVDEIGWKATDGAPARGGLYLPPDYLPGRRYPLVIQILGWGPDSREQFQIDGGATSGFAAQALAGQGFVVAEPIQAGAFASTLEGPKNMAIIEGLIDYLDEREMVDRDRVGLFGWSRGGYTVRYTLAFSKYPIAAAAIADGMDGGYWQYLSELNAGERVWIREMYEGQNGASPFGAGLKSWLEHAASFNLTRIHTPIRQLGFGPYWFECNWEWFVGLKRLGKPVEMIWLPQAAHELVRPLERLTAQQGDVDWFRFWLKGEEDPDPSKSQQYARWRRLRKSTEVSVRLSK